MASYAAYKCRSATAASRSGGPSRACSARPRTPRRRRAARVGACRCPTRGRSCRLRRCALTRSARLPPVAATPGGRGTRRRRGRRASRNGRGPPAAGGSGVPGLATRPISLAPASIVATSPWSARSLEAVGQPAVRVGGRGRRARLEGRNEPDPHARHQRIRPQRRHELLEPGVGRVAERDESDHTPVGVLSGDPFGRCHRVDRTSVGPDDAAHVEPEVASL